MLRLAQRGGLVTLVIQKTTNVEWGGPCQHLPLYKLRIAYGEGSVGSFHLSKVIFFLFETTVVKKVQVLEVLVEAKVVFVPCFSFFGGIAAGGFFCLRLRDIEFIEVGIPFFFLFDFFPFVDFVEIFTLLVIFFSI